VWGHESEEFLEGRLSRAVSILGTDKNHITTLDVRLHAMEKIGAPYEHGPNKYDLELHTPAELGIINKGRRRDEIYVDRDNQTLAGFITCNVDRSVPSPGCSHEFLYRNLLMRVTYRKPFLPQWRSIEHRVKELLDSFMRQAFLGAPRA
jgi:hypothetical protein